MVIRKDANTLSSDERLELTSTILELKRRGIYDQFVLRHANANMRAIHRCPAFLPWHRRFIWDFERELQRVSGNSQLALPYWNWAEGSSNASMWDDDLLGGNGDPVTQVVNSGPFKRGEWTVVNSGGRAAGPLTRAFGREPWARSLPTHQQILQVLAITPYDIPAWDENVNQSFRNQLEGFVGPNLHNRGHGWVGGSMLPMTSPNDPVFFMHHCMVDKIWYEWQLRFPRQGYLPVRGGSLGQNLNDPMDSTASSPLGSRPFDVLDSRDLNIEYDKLFSGTPPPQAIGKGRELIVDASDISAQIGVGGEEDKYYFETTEVKSLTIETKGNSDTTLTLFDSDSSTSQIGFNDDGGDRFNSKINQSLPAGRYSVFVRLYDGSATGDYQLSVRSDSTMGTSGIPNIPVNGLALEAEIVNASEIDLFRFIVQTQGIYVIETTGATDTYMNLFGPDSQAEAIAENDDSGINRNSRLQRLLDAGEYFVRIRHYDSAGTGAYKISVVG